MCNGHHFLHKRVLKESSDKTTTPLKWSNAKVSIAPIIFPSASFLDKVGVSNIAKIVLHHHRLLQKSSIAHMYPTDEAHFQEGVSKASHFLIEALGGEKVYTFSYGAPALCRTHAPFVIDDEGRAEWLMLYKQTLHDLDFPKELIKEFWNWIEPFSLRMINKRNSAMPTKRFWYEDMKAEFGLI